MSVDNGDPTSSKKLCVLCFDLIFVPHLIASVQALNLLFVSLNISIDVNTACIIVCSTISEANDLSSKVVGLAFCGVCHLFSLLLHG